MTKLFYIFIISLLGIFSASGANAALSVTTDDVTEAVREAFMDEGVDADMDIEFFGGSTTFALPQDSDFKIMVSGLKYDEVNNKFTCTIDVFSEGQNIGRSELIGKYYLLDGVFVPARNINKGEIISDADLKKVMVRHNRIKDVNITSKDKLINKEAKRMLKSGKLIMNSEVGDKILIKKGDYVTAIYQTAKMQITTRAQAQEDGSKNDRIELQNPKSKKAIFGTVIDSETVQIEIQ